MFRALEILKAHIAASLGIFALLALWNFITGSVAGLGETGPFVAVFLAPATWGLVLFVRRGFNWEDHLKAAGGIFLLTLGFLVFFGLSIEGKDSFTMALFLGPATWLNIQVTLYYRKTF